MVSCTFSLVSERKPLQINSTARVLLSEAFLEKLGAQYLVMEGAKRVLTILVIYVACTSGVSLAGSSSAGGDGFLLDLLLANLNAFDLRVQQQMDLLQNNIVRNRQAMESLAERIANMEDGAKETDGELSAKLQQVKHAANSSVRAISDKLQVIEDSILSLAPVGEQLGEDPSLVHESRFEMVKNNKERDAFSMAHYFINETVYRGLWLVFQRRHSGAVDFNRGWVQYQNGFGDIHDEHWLGLDRLHWLLSSKRHELLILLKDFTGTVAVAHYDDFVIEGEGSDYRLLSLGRYSGTAGDSLWLHQGKRFSTFDNDNDASPGNCAERFMGGWWFNNCYQSYLNGVYLHGAQRQTVRGIEWFTFRGFYYSMKEVAMMIRPAP